MLRAVYYRGMITHHILLRWQQTLSEDGIDAALRRLVALPLSVPGLTAVYAGKNYRDKAFSFSHTALIAAANEHAMREFYHHLHTLEIQATLAKEDVDFVPIITLGDYTQRQVVPR